MATGIHTIEVQARINLEVSAQGGASSARALIGKSSMVVEQVRMVKTPLIELQ